MLNIPRLSSTSTLYFISLLCALVCLTLYAFIFVCLCFPVCPIVCLLCPFCLGLCYLVLVLIACILRFENFLFDWISLKSMFSTLIKCLFKPPSPQVLFKINIFVKNLSIPIFFFKTFLTWNSRKNQIYISFIIKSSSS